MVRCSQAIFLRRERAVRYHRTYNFHFQKQRKMEQKKNIYEKIQAVADAIRYVEKTKVVGTGSNAYKAVTDGDVLAKVKDAERENRIVSIPVSQELVRSEIIRTASREGYEKIMYADIVKMTVEIINLDNPTEKVTVESFGRGLDAGDKGFGKASTYARKYALLNAYKIMTGDDPDEQKSVTTEVNAQVEHILDVKNYINDHPEYAEKVFSYFKVGNVDQLNADQIASIHRSITQKY